MISVTPIERKEDQAQLCALCGVVYLADALAYRATDENGAFAGICQFSMDAQGGHIFHLAAPDGGFDDALFVMGRAALSFIDLCGVKTADFRGEADDSLLRRIGFSTNGNGQYTVSLEGFFNHPCSHASH